MARARVEPEGFAPVVGAASGTFTIDAVARVEPIGDIPPVPAPPFSNVAGVSGNAVTVGGPRDGFTTVVGADVAQSWDNSDPSNTDTIRVQEATNSGFTAGLVEHTLDGSATERIWTNQKDAVTRYYRVRAENGSGPSAWSNVVSVKHIEDPPGAPQNLVASSLTSTSIRMEWTAPVTGGSVLSYRLVDDQSNEGFAQQSPDAIVDLEEGSGHSVSVFAVGPDGQAGPLASYVGQAVRHATPGLSGCVEGGSIYRLNITDSGSLRAQNNTSVSVYRDDALYDTLSDGDQQYQPSHQSGSWHVVSTGGTASTPLNGSVTIPASAKSSTRTMPFTVVC